MTEAATSEMPHSLADRAPDASLAIAALRQAGAGQLDPVRLHYLDALARRTQAQKGAVKRILEHKLAQALAVFAARVEQAQGQARDHIDRVTPHDPRTSLGELVRAMAHQTPDKAEGHGESHGGSRPELKTMRHFRNTWSKLSVEKQLTQALGQAPKNAGPINSHMLVVRSLALMREISPDYLNRYMSYVDTLLCLDQSDQKSKPLPKKTPGVKAAKRPVPRQAAPLANSGAV